MFENLEAKVSAKISFVDCKSKCPETCKNDKWTFYDSDYGADREDPTMLLTCAKGNNKNRWLELEIYVLIFTLNTWVYVASLLNLNA